MKNKVFALVLLITLLLPINVWAVEDVVSSEEQAAEEVVLEESPETILEPQNQYKQPISKKKIAKKFIAAMGGVTASSFLIFLLLTVYNRFRDKYMNLFNTIDGEASLDTPDNMSDAVKTFLNKTKW